MYEEKKAIQVAKKLLGLGKNTPAQACEVRDADRKVWFCVQNGTSQIQVRVFERVATRIGLEAIDLHEWDTASRGLGITKLTAPPWFWLSQTGGGDTFYVSQAQADAMQKILPFASTDDKRSAIGGVFVNETRAIACDGFTLGQIDVSAEGAFDKGVVIPRKLLEVLPNEPLSVTTWANGETRFSGIETELHVLLDQDHRFPQTENIVPKNPMRPAFNAANIVRLAHGWRIGAKRAKDTYSGEGLGLFCVEPSMVTVGHGDRFESVFCSGATPFEPIVLDANYLLRGAEMSPMLYVWGPGQPVRFGELDHCAVVIPMSKKALSAALRAEWDKTQKPAKEAVAV